MVKIDSEAALAEFLADTSQQPSRMCFPDATFEIDDRDGLGRWDALVLHTSSVARKWLDESGKDCLIGGDWWYYIRMESTITIGAFVLGVTQIIKDFGLDRGQYLKLIAILLGALAMYLTVYRPETWETVSSICLAAGITGSVSFIDERRSS